MKNIRLTDEQYDYVMGSDSLEEIKNILSQNHDSNNDDIVNQSSISVRLLSFNEYNKYIKNSTANGSITKYSDAVWHCAIVNSKQCYWCGGTKYGQGWNNNFYPGGISYSQATFIGDTSSGVATLTLNDLFTEILASNTSNTNTVESHIEIGLHVGARFNDSCSWAHGAFSLITKNISKDAPRVSDTLNIYCNSGYSSGSRRGILTINVNVAFRPVFTIKDNQKSANIFC